MPVDSFALRILALYRRHGVSLIIGAVIYFVAAKAGISMLNLKPENIAVLWLPSGIALVMLLRFGWIALPFMFAPDYFANLNGMLTGAGHSPYLFTAFIATSDLGENLLAWWVFRRFTPDGLTDVRNLLTFGFLVCLVPTTLSGVSTGNILHLGGFISSDEIQGIIKSYMLSDGLGILLIYPLFQAWTHVQPLSKHAVNWLVLGMIILAGIGLMAFSGLHGLVYFMLPVLLGLTVQVGLRGTTVLLAMVVMGIVAHTAHHQGPFSVEADSMDNYFTMMAFVYTMTFTVLAFAINQEQLMETSQSRETWRDKAKKDFLTGALSRQAFVDESLRHLGVRTALVMLDLDHFKKVNDQYGHMVGDQALIKFVEVTTGCLRNGDILGRWGGEEFLVLLPDTTESQAVAVAERIRKACESTSLICETNELSLTTSIGVALRLNDIDTLEEMIVRADTALYAAKNAGRNRVVLYA